MPSHLAIGIFDGVHRGHQAVISKAVENAQADSTLAGVLTFFPHPSRLFRPNEATKLILPLEVKCQLIAQLHVHTIICEPFTPEFGALQAEAFLPHLKKYLPTLKTVFIGENFRFGKQRLGNPGKMAEWGKALNIDVVAVPNVCSAGETISSTRIRKSITQGNIANANEYLGYVYFCTGNVQPGRQLGRTLGFPTLNLAWEPELQPAYGVYAVRVTDQDGRSRNGVANYGLRPTLQAGETSPILEVHILGDCPWDTDSDIRVEWLHFIRPERTFENLTALKQQIATDCEHARNWHTKH